MGPDRTDRATGTPVPSIDIVLRWYRRRISADRFPNRAHVEVPPALAGWVVPDPGDSTDPDGLRPLGDVLERLLRLVDAAGLAPQEREVVTARMGLTEYPARHPPRPLGERVPVHRHHHGRGGVGRRRLLRIYRDAVHRLDGAGALDPREHPPVPAEPVPDPALAPWFRDRVPADWQADRLRAAVESARSFVSAAGLSRWLDGPHRELDDYEATLAGSEWPRPAPAGRSRAHALVGVALWAQLRWNGQDVGVTAALRSGRIEPPPSFDVAAGSEALGHLLADDVDSGTALAACDDTLRCDRADHAQAGVMADLLLGCYARHRGRLGRNAEASILRTVIRVRSVDEDPTVLSLLRLVLTEHPATWQALDAAQVAVPVASGHRLHDRAEQLYRWNEEALRRDFRLLPGRVRRVETTEFRLWNCYQRIGAARRRLDHGDGTTGDVSDMLTRGTDMQRLLHDVEHLNETEGRGDATPAWGFHVLLRSAEARLVAAHRATARPGSPQGRAALTDLGRAERVLLDCGLGSDTRARVELMKAKLRAALVFDEPDAARCQAEAIGRTGWPITRTPLFADGFGLDRLAPPVRAVAVEYLHRQSNGTPTIVDGTTRRRHVAP